MSTNSNNSASFGKLNLAAVQNIIAKRKRIEAKHAGEPVDVFIQSNGTTIAVLDKAGAPVMSGNGLPLTKTIYNVAANSTVAMMNPRNREILATAHAAEQQGDDETAHNAYNDYLNKIQVSFSVMHNPGAVVTPFTKNQLITGVVQLITTENGQLITLEKPSVKASVKLADTAKLSLNALLGITDADPKAADVFTPVDGATAPVVTE